jgi:transcriptional regulator with XRE-family HTH domain
MDKRDRSALFRTRLQTAMTLSGDTQSSLSRKTGADRSTLSQILIGTDARLPNANLVAECAQSLGVSADWLLGLSDQPEPAAQVLAQAMTMADAPRALIDAQIFAWHQEAAGYKIRHVPAGLPDMIKIHEMLEWEYEPTLGRTIGQAIGASEDRLNWMSKAQSDYEIALPLHDLYAFSRAEGYYHNCPRDIRIKQLKHLKALVQRLYPSLRLSLFDARRIYSAPITIFGPLLAAIYLGQKYLVFRDRERISALTQHFDGLIREAHIGSRGLPHFIQTLLDEIT